MCPSFTLLAVLAAGASAATIVVNAGQNGFTYTPNTLTANVGDTVEFHFFTNFHTVVQGDFDTPCAMGSLSATGFDSGPVTNGDVFAVSITSTDPIWFYCVTPTHCQSGMVGVINPPASGNTLASYKSSAAGTSSSSSAGKLQGGVLNPQGGSSSSSSSSTSASSSSSSTPPKTSSSASPSATSSSSGSSTSSTASSSRAGNSTATTSATSTGGSGTTSVKASSTSSTSSSPSSVVTSSAGALWEMVGRFAVLSSIFGLGAIVVLMN